MRKSRFIRIEKKYIKQPDKIEFGTKQKYPKINNNIGKKKEN